MSARKTINSLIVGRLERPEEEDGTHKPKIAIGTIATADKFNPSCSAITFELKPLKKGDEMVENN